MEDFYPISRPLFNLKELIEWSEINDGHSKCRVSRVPFIPPPIRRDDRPKLLVCHDMKGGYLEDRIIQGVSLTDCYRFNHWWNVDTFVYFSHYFVTLPPPCWIDAGHRHNVKVLGTLITEWEPGRKMCEEFLKDAETFKNTADQLVRLAQFYQFDGWLINIENELQSEEAVTLKAFLRYLTEQLHRRIKGSEVIWYDSVIAEGKRIWQNELNDKNKCFFDSCDGIFLNYTWKEENLRSTVDLAKNCGRLCDVYVGVDVFGRGCFGGGGFDTNKAVQMASSLNLSVALFGIGWTLEKLETGRNFSENDERFWSLLQSFCEKKKITSLPLVTSFCQGWGEKYYCRGQMLKDECWTSMSLQQIQPTDVGRSDTTRYITDDGYFGGGCLEFTQNESAPEIRLFAADVTLSGDLLISFTYKAIVSGQFEIVMTIKRCNSGKSSHIRLRNDDSCFEGVDVDETVVTANKPIPTEDGPSWISREFCLSDVSGCRLEEISVKFLSNPRPCVFRLGELQVKLKPEEPLSDALKSILDHRTVKGRLYKIECPRITADVVTDSESNPISELESAEDQTMSESAYSVETRSTTNEDGSELVNATASRTEKISSFPGLNLKLTWNLTDLEGIDRFHVFVRSAIGCAWHFLGQTPICSFSCYFDIEPKDFNLNRFKLDVVLTNGEIVSDVNVDSMSPSSQSLGPLLFVPNHFVSIDLELTRSPSLDPQSLDSQTLSPHKQH